MSLAIHPCDNCTSDRSHHLIVKISNMEHTHTHTHTHTYIYIITHSAFGLADFTSCEIQMKSKYPRIPKELSISSTNTNSIQDNMLLSYH